MDRWTHKEESELKRLIARKHETTTKNMAPLIALARAELTHEQTAERLAEALAANADAFRDALEPFDSGMRQGSPSAA